MYSPNRTHHEHCTKLCFHVHCMCTHTAAVCSIKQPLHPHITSHGLHRCLICLPAIPTAHHITFPDYTDQSFPHVPLVSQYAVCHRVVVPSRGLLCDNKGVRDRSDTCIATGWHYQLTTLQPWVSNPGIWRSGVWTSHWHWVKIVMRCCI